MQLHPIRCFVSLSVSSVILLSVPAVAQTREAPVGPNILIVYADDLGYGDIGVQGGRIPTPRIDGLALQGLRFTAAHSTSATCTPSRYSLLTGEYAWRRQGTGVANGDAGLIIEPGRETLPAMLKRKGYRTAVIGKWHLGLGGPGGPDWNGEIRPGPKEVGFDKSFIMPSTGDRVPCVFVEDGRVVRLSTEDPIHVDYRNRIGGPTGRESPGSLRLQPTQGHDQSIVNGISRIGYMAGGRSALWRDEDIADTLLSKAAEFIRSSEGEPFFLFFPTHDIHVPRMAHERFRDLSGRGPRGDVILQLDETVGRLLDLLDTLRLRENTLVILTSDNGPVLNDGYADEAFERLGDHDPNGGLRGGKYSAFEAGTRVPMVVSWPGRVRRGDSSTVMFSQVDLLGSLADLTGLGSDASMARDSENRLAELLGSSGATGRTHLVEEAVSGVLSLLRSDGYKYIPASKGPKRLTWAPQIETGFEAFEQLYHLPSDRSERRNLAASRPDVLGEMRSRWMQLVK